MSSKQFYPPSHPSRRVLVLSFPAWLSLPKRVSRWGWVVIAVVATNLFTLWYSQTEPRAASSSPALAWWSSEEPADLYLLDKASAVVSEPHMFARKVHEVAQQLGIPAEWLMAVMYAESRFDPAVVNRRGSRATGLIQFMPATAQDLGVSTAALGQMSAVDQMDYVYRYLSQVRDRYGNYQSLTDLYLGILYPKARQQDYCFSLYAKPSLAYQRNRGLDENKDGRVSVSDIDQYLRRLFPTAYLKSI